MIKNLTNLTWDMQRIATEKGTQRCVKQMKAETTAALGAIVPSLTVRLGHDHSLGATNIMQKLVRSMEPYVGTSMIGNQRAGKGDILVTRFTHCVEEWNKLGKQDAKDSKAPNIARSGFS
jgi:hypothetical protein